MVRINSVEDLIKYSKYIPIQAMLDIDKRISDWLSSGGKEDAFYVKQQFRYAENIVNLFRGDK